MSNLEIQSADQFDLASCDIQASLRPASRNVSVNVARPSLARSVKENDAAINSLISSIVREQVMKR